MIFSAWRPDGGYDYYEASVRHGIGDDLPEAELPPSVKGLGVPAQDAGRRLPPGARLVGNGPRPRGVLVPMDRGQVQGLRGTDASGGSSFWTPVLVVMAAALFYDWYRDRKKA
jgi:hypothetical protein